MEYRLRFVLITVKESESSSLENYEIKKYVRLSARTPGFHPGKEGSTPSHTTINKILKNESSKSNLDNHSLSNSFDNPNNSLMVTKGVN